MFQLPARSQLIFLAALTAITACQPAPADRFPAEWRFSEGGKSTFAEHAMVASNSELASRAGVEILRQGGNAVDAAVATGFALAVAYPQAGNLGGGGFMVIRMADGRTAALDYREVAPLAATRNMFLDAEGNLTDKSLVGALASGVPGAVAGMTEALEKYGTLPLAEVMKPAIELATEGFIVDSALWRSLRGHHDRITRFEGDSVFFPGGGEEPLAPGTRLVQPALARTLQLIAAKGAKGFYEGETADSIAAEMRRDGGIITTEDLALYRPLWREPVIATYRGYSVIAMPPSSSGGITTVEALNILATYDHLPPFGSAGYDHLLAEAFRRAFVDRNTKLGDPAFVEVPREQLTSKSYARELASSIDLQKASRTPSFGAAVSEDRKSVV